MLIELPLRVRERLELVGQPITEDDARRASQIQMVGQLAPIALLAFRRPLTTLQTLFSLSRCPEAAESELHVFCDGPRHEGERRDVELTREVVRSQRWCGSVNVVCADENRGLARSVTAAVTSLCKRHGRVIVIEDDLVLSRGFLSYMNRSLDLYAQEERVMAISGHRLEIGASDRAVFLPLVTTWGWSTWARAWEHYQEVPRGIERLEDPAFASSFDLDKSHAYTDMLRAQLAGHIDSWGIRWWWSVHDRGGLSLVPPVSLVRNIGTGEGATHTREASAIVTSSASFDLDNAVSLWPLEVGVDRRAFDDVKKYLRSMQRQPSLRSRAGRVARAIGRAGLSTLRSLRAEGGG